MLHEPAVKLQKDPASDWKAKLGIKLFWLYGLIYAVFVGLAIYATDTLRIPVLAGVNLAVMYGMGLIVSAILLGLVYNHVCTKKEDAMHQVDREEP